MLCIKCKPALPLLLKIETLFFSFFLSLFSLNSKCQLCNTSYWILQKLQPLHHCHNPHKPASSWQEGWEKYQAHQLAWDVVLWKDCSTWMCSWQVQQKVACCNPMLAQCMSVNCHTIPPRSTITSQQIFKK